ncbi:hypothetical protein GCM10009595_16650 [Falsarthrobacter nasiphocae]
MSLIHGFLRYLGLSRDPSTQEATPTQARPTRRTKLLAVVVGLGVFVVLSLVPRQVDALSALVPLIMAILTAKIALGTTPNPRPSGSRTSEPPSPPTPRHSPTNRPS